MAVHVFHKDAPSVKLPMISKDARLVVWPGTGSKVASMNYVSMEPGERNLPHAHAESEDTVFIVEGEGSITDVTSNITLDIRKDIAVHVPAGIMHFVSADKGQRIISVGGPAPADLLMLARMGVEIPR